MHQKHDTYMKFIYIEIEIYLTIYTGDNTEQNGGWYPILGA